jgi:hypothetical protein
VGPASDAGANCCLCRSHETVRRRHGQPSMLDALHMTGGLFVIELHRGEEVRRCEPMSWIEPRRPTRKYDGDENRARSTPVPLGCFASMWL